MRADSVAWERAAEVRGAATAWRLAGFIDQPTERAIQERFPDPCVAPSPVWRALTAGAVAAVVLCTFGALAVTIGRSATAAQIVLGMFAAVCLVVTDRLEASPQFARRGAAGATSLLGVGFFLAAVALFLMETLGLRANEGIDLFLIVSLLAWALGWWRWGSPLFAALSALSLFLLLGRLSHGRLLWLLVGAALVGLAARRLDAESWAPSHRLGASVLAVAGIAAVYAAINRYSLDEHLIETLARFSPERVAPSRTAFAPSAVATAAVPLAVLAWSLRSRRTFVLGTGIVLMALSLLTLHHYVYLAPLWVVLSVAGATLVIVALVVERVLGRAPDREMWGFTGEPLFSDERRQHALQIVGAAATFTPATGTDRPGFAGEGGKFGGGGATEKF